MSGFPLLVQSKTDTHCRDIEQWSDSDEEFSEIFRHCVKNKDKCSLARDGATAVQLEQSVWDLIERLKYQPIIVGDQILDDRALRISIVLNLYLPRTWPDFTRALDMLINGDVDDVFLTRVFKLDAGNAAFDIDVNEFQAVMAIRGSDRSVRAGSLDNLIPFLEKVANTSKVFDGPENFIHIPSAQWKFNAKERYEGDFQVTPREPVLVIGNTWDGLTPLRSAHNVSSGFEGSVVLEVNGHGVSEFALLN